MSKLLSEEQVFEAFMNHTDKVYHINLRKHLASPSPEIYVEQFLKDEYQAFKSAFTLLMPIIEKLEGELEFYASGDAHDANDSWVEYYENGHTRFATGKRARKAIQETKQMLEKLATPKDCESGVKH